MRKVALLVAITVALLTAFVSFQAIAQQNGGTPASVAIPAQFNQPPASAANGNGPAATNQRTLEPQESGTVVINGVRYYLTTKTQYEFWLALMTVVLGLSAMVFICLLFRNHLSTKSEDFVKLFAFVVVVFAAIFLIAVGYSDSQTAPVYSLLGTIIGYIFGREVTGSQARRDERANGPAEDGQANPATPEPNGAR